MTTKSTLVSLGMLSLLFAPTSVPAQPAQMPAPAQGQTQEQMNMDRAACEQEASMATGFNPYAATAPEESRGSSALRKGARGAAAGAVIGAIAGDAGKGAAIGATAGGTSGLLGKRKGVLSGAAVGAAAGAVGGDAGKGAAAGAALGAIGGIAQRGQENKEAQQQLNYNNAFNACMTRRGYRFPTW